LNLILTMSDLETLSRLSIDAKDAAKRMYSASESLERYMIKNNKYLSRVLPDLKKIKKGLETTTKVATEVKQALPDLKKISKTAKETADKAKQVADTAKQVGGKAKEVTDLLEKGDFGKVNKNLSKGVSGGAVAIGLAGGALVVGTIAVKLQEDINNIAFSQLEQTGKELGTQLNIIVKHDASLKTHEKRLDALSSDYDVLAGYQAQQTLRLNNQESKFIFFEQETKQELKALSEVVKISNINSYNNDLKLQNQILELAEKIKKIKENNNTNSNQLELALINAKFEALNNLIANQNKLSEADFKKIKLDLNKLNNKINQYEKANNNNVNTPVNLSNLWNSINSTNAKLEAIKLNYSNHTSRLDLIETDLPLKFEARRKFEALTEKQFKEQEKINSNLKTDIGNVKTDIGNSETKLTKIIDGKIKPLSGGFADLGSDFFKLRDDLNNIKKIPIINNPNSPNLELIKKEIGELKIKQQETDKVNKEGNDLIKNILPSILPLLYAIPAKTADTIKPAIPTIPQIETASATGTCRTFQPGGCSRTNLDNLASDIKTNNNTGNAGLWNKINAGLNGANLAGSAAQMAILNQIDGKLGAKLPNGGLSGFLQNFLKRFDDFAKWMHLDRILNVLIWWQTLHNAAMLSNNVVSTLAQSMSNVLSFLGIKDVEGNAIDIGSVVGKAYTEMLKSALGETTYNNLNKTWNAANRIYQSAANILGAIQSIHSTILSVLEILGAKVARLANALKAAGQVFENAYEWMNPQPNYTNSFFVKLESLQQTASNIEQVTQAPLDIKGAVEGMKSEIGEIQKATADGEKALKGLGVIESENKKTEAIKRKGASQSSDLASYDKVEADD
jgi:hypothetical protein